MKYMKKRKVPSASSGSEELDQVVGGHVEKSIQVDASEAELLERPLLWGLPSHRHISFHIRLKPKTPIDQKQAQTNIHREREREIERERGGVLTMIRLIR